MKSKIPANRTETGQFAKGKSGNPRGRPKNTPEQVDALHRLYALAPAAVEEAKRILTDPNENSAVKIRLVEMILDRTYGKSAQTLTIDDDRPVIVDNVRGAGTNAAGTAD